jgi:hypothetical protein
VGVQTQHLPVQFGRRLCRFHDPIEVSNVLACLLDNPRVVAVVNPLVSSDDCPWPKRFDGIESVNPLASRLARGLGEVKVNIVVGGIPGDD